MLPSACGVSRITSSGPSSWGPLTRRSPRPPSLRWRYARVALLHMLASVWRSSRSIRAPARHRRGSGGPEFELDAYDLTPCALTLTPSQDRERELEGGGGGEMAQAETMELAKRNTRRVRIGDVTVGGEAPVVVQSM